MLGIVACFWRSPGAQHGFVKAALISTAAQVRAQIVAVCKMPASSPLDAAQRTADAIRRISASCNPQHLRWLLFGRWIYAWTRDGLMWSLADQGGSLAAAGHGAWLQTTRCWRLWPCSSKALSAHLTIPLKPGGIFASPRVAFGCRQRVRSSPGRVRAAQPPAANLCSSQHQPKQHVQWAPIEVFRGKYHRFIPRAVTQ